MEDSIRSDLHFNDAEGTVCLLNEEIFEGLARIRYEKPSQKLTFYKAYFPPNGSSCYTPFCNALVLKPLLGMNSAALWRTNDDKIFGVDDLTGEEVVMDTTTGEHEEQIIEDVSTTEPVTTAGEVVTTTVKDSAAPTRDVTKDEITMVQALVALKGIKPNVVVQEQEISTIIPTTTIIFITTVPTLRAKGIVFHEQKQSQIPIVSSSKDKDKAKMIEPGVPIKKKDQMRIDEEYARKLEAEEQKAARLSRAQQDEEANNS
nr:hypothetical protein [Tanacetum cinerariifolium]